MNNNTFANQQIPQYYVKNSKRGLSEDDVHSMQSLDVITLFQKSFESSNYNLASYLGVYKLGCHNCFSKGTSYGSSPSPAVWER